MPDASPERNWIVCQIGARENYTIPRALHRAGRLEMLLTDIWHPPGGLAGDWMSHGRMFRRWHADLADATVCAANRSHLALEAFTRARNDAKTWGAILRRNARFQRNSLRILRRHAATNPGQAFTVFAFSYAAREIFQFAKSQGWKTVLGQIDPGPQEETIVAEEHRRHPQSGSTWKPAPPEYWQHWREETELADEILCNSEWARDGLITAGVTAEKIRIVPLFYEADAPERSADLQSAPETPANRGAGILPAAQQSTGGLPPTPRLRRAGKSALHSDQGPRTKDSAKGATDQGRDAVAPLKVLFLGNVCLRKGIARLIEAMRLLRDQPVHLSIYGHLSVSPDLWRDLPNVTWAGSVRNPDIQSIYASADVFILPTLSDGFARTQLEALAAGTPVIASRHCGHVVIDGQNGFLLEQNTPEEIAALLASLATDRSRLATCETTMLPEAMAHSLEELAGMILGGDASRIGKLPASPPATDAPRRSRLRTIIRPAAWVLALTLSASLAVGGWIRFGDWPHVLPPEPLENPGLILVLGGGDQVRIREALRIAKSFPNSSILVTGDGGLIFDGLIDGGIAPERIEIEPDADSTYTNARLCAPWVQRTEGSIVLVTNDFHIPRAKGTFRKVFPGRDFATAYEVTPEPYSKYEEGFRRRERAAALYYLVRYGVNSFRD